MLQTIGVIADETTSHPTKLAENASKTLVIMRRVHLDACADVPFNLIFGRNLDECSSGN